MAGTPIDLATWDRAETFRFFRGFQRPHFAITARADVSRLMAAKDRSGVSLFRACLWALGAGLNAAPELRTRFRGDDVTLYDRIDVSPVVSMPDGGFRFAYIPWQTDWPAFDRDAEARIADVRKGSGLNPDASTHDGVAYLSPIPWLDFTALSNAMPKPEDNIPRAAWGKIVPKNDGFDMSVGIELHHAIADGRHAGAFFERTAEALSSF